MDTTFGTQGTVTTITFSVDGAAPVAATAAQAWGVVVQSSGNIVAGGRCNIAVGIADVELALVRYTSAGVLDTSFGTQGTVATSYFSYLGAAPIVGDDNRANAITLQSDDKIVAAGQSDVNRPANPAFVLARYSSNGALDTTFGNGGTMTTSQFSVNGAAPTLSSDSQAFAVTLGLDGKIVVGGTSRARGDGLFDFTLAEYTNNYVSPAAYLAIGGLVG